VGNRVPLSVSVCHTLAMIKNIRKRILTTATLIAAISTPVLAEEESVLSDLSKSHPSWELRGHFYAPLVTVSTKHSETIEGNVTFPLDVDFGFPYRPSGIRTSQQTPLDLRRPNEDDHWEMPDGFAGWAAF
jgi:hypothetical protein